MYHICQKKGLDSALFICDKCLRGCFTTDLESTNCITNVMTNSSTPGVLKYSRMHLSDRKISLMLEKANRPTIRALLIFRKKIVFSSQKLRLKFQILVWTANLGIVSGPKIFVKIFCKKPIV